MKQCHLFSYLRINVNIFFNVLFQSHLFIDLLKVTIFDYYRAFEMGSCKNHNEAVITPRKLVVAFSNPIGVKKKNTLSVYKICV